ncbi:hypothetical protein D9M73_172800 [compost metagenome]
MLYVLAQFADLAVVVAQQGAQALIVQLRVLITPGLDARLQISQRLLLCLELLLAGLQFAGQLHLFGGAGLQVAAGRRLALARAFHRLLQLLLPGLRAGMLTEQCLKLLAACL